MVVGEGTIQSPQKEGKWGFLHPTNFPGWVREKSRARGNRHRKKGKRGGGCLLRYSSRCRLGGRTVFPHYPFLEEKEEVKEARGSLWSAHQKREWVRNLARSDGTAASGRGEAFCGATLAGQKEKGEKTSSRRVCQPTWGGEPSQCSSHIGMSRLNSSCAACKKAAVKRFSRKAHFARCSRKRRRSPPHCVGRTFLRSCRKGEKGDNLPHKDPQPSSTSQVREEGTAWLPCRLRVRGASEGKVHCES